MNSMTGYASQKFIVSNFKFFVEIKSYNHKYLDIFVKLPKFLGSLELPLKKEVSNYVSRGRVEFIITLLGSDIVQNIDLTMVGKVISLLNEIKKKYKLKGDVELKDIFLLKEVFFLQQNEIIALDRNFEKKFLAQCKKVLKSFLKSRMDEGSALEDDIVKRVALIESKFASLKKELPKIKKIQTNRIKQKFKEIFQNNIDKVRLEQEIVYLIDKLDVTEEVTRLDGHLKNFKNTLKEKGAIGKKLDFYLQEIFRELNTLSVKTQDFNVSQVIIDIKTEAEKIREQVQNVE
jgi:uncharacterized protein (TIGR00255 family)